MSDRPMHTQPGLFDKLVQIYAEGDQLVQEGQFQAAVDKFTEGLALDDHFRQRYVTMYAQRAFAYQRMGNLQAAIADYTKAIEMEPEINQAQYHFHRGLCYAGLDQPERAVEDYSRSIELYPNHPGPYHMRGKLYLDVFDRVDEALADFDKLLAISPNPDGFKQRGLAKYILERYDDALADLAQSNELRPDVYNDYLAACCFAKLQRPERLLAAVQATLAADPSYRDNFLADDEFESARQDPAFRALIGA